MRLTGQESSYFPLSNKKSEIQNEVSHGAKGGTELMFEQLKKRVPSELLNNFQIICSRVRHVDKNRPSILWLHDTYDDPESQHLQKKESVDRFAQLVFVSYHQFQGYHLAHGIPYSKSIVLKNAIEPIEDHEKPKDKIRLIYHTTPHRGLEILVPVFMELYNYFNKSIHLDVFSNFSLYGQRHLPRNQPYEELFQMCRDHPGITYHGAVDNQTIRTALKQAHIFAYPSIWPETSGISVIEAMSAKCSVVCSSFGALPETTSGFSIMYPFHEDKQTHARVFGGVLKKTIDNYKNPSDNVNLQQFNNFAKSYVDTFYNWNSRAEQWRGMLEGLMKSSK